MATLTTVGYGDTLPITLIGKFLGAIIAIMGIGIFALPTAILSASLIEEFRRPTEPARCPHCDKELTMRGMDGKGFFPASGAHMHESGFRQATPPASSGYRVCQLLGEEVCII